jgi:hypothetical protein
MAQPMKALAHGNAMLQKEAADLIDDRSPLPNQSIAHAVQRLKIELFIGFCRYTQRRWTLYGFSDRQRITKVVLVVLPEWFGINRWHLPYVVADGEQLAGHIVRSHPRLYSDQAGRHIPKPSHNAIARHLLAQDNSSSSI